MTKIYKGVHGTCRTWGQQIRQDGFSQSLGRLGFGAYFWRYYDHDDYAKFLAFKWWQYKFNKGDYNSGSLHARDCAILKCYFVIEYEETEVLDITNGSAKEKLIDIIKTETLRMQKEVPTAKINNVVNGLIESYIDTVEQEQNTPIKIIISDLAIPKGSGGLVGKCFGSSAEAVIVRDSSCVKIESIEEIDYYEYV